MTDWKEIHEDFTRKLQKKWQRKGFSYAQTKEWISVGLQITDASYAEWLRDVKKIYERWDLNYGGNKKMQKELREEYELYLREIVDGSRLSLGAIKQLRDFENVHSEWWKIKKESSLRDELINKLIPTKELKEKYEKYGLCKECSQLNIERSYYNYEALCQSCGAKYLQQEFSTWTSGNKKIDELIQKSRLEATSQNDNILEWIPYKEFDGIRRFAKGGFATVYRAQCEKYGEVILKVLNNSENITNEFLQEIDNHRLFDSNTRIVKCYGISQDPKSKNYAIVMSYIDGDNLSQYLKKQKQWISFEDKIEQLKEIAGGVKDIHERRLIHRDLHPGNIIVKSNFVSNYFYKMYNDMQKHNAKKKRNAMHAYVSYMIYTTSLNHDDGKNYYPLFPDNDSKLAKLEYSSLDNESLLSCEKHKHEEEEKSGSFSCYITDLGLCKPADAEKKEERIYGVLPYVAPEVLQGKPYTQAADIYSFGIIAYELLANSYPYPELDGIELALAVCQGYRPSIDELKIPQLLKDLIKRCWDASLKNRPSAEEIERVIVNWQKEVEEKNNTEFYQQYQTIKKEYDAFSQTTLYQIHPQAVTTSKLINTKIITQLLQQQKTEQSCSAMSKSISLDLNQIGEQLKETNLKEKGETSLQAQIQISPKKQ